MRMADLEQGMHDLCLEQEMLVRWDREKVLMALGIDSEFDDHDNVIMLLNELIDRACCYESTLAATEMMAGVIYKRADWSKPQNERLEVK